MRAFLLEEQRIVKKVLKAKAGDASKEESAAPTSAPVAKEAEKGKETSKKAAAPKKK